MKFDIFEATELMEETLGEGCELLIRKKGSTYSIRLMLWDDVNKIFHSSEFAIAQEQITDDQYRRFNMLFSISMNEIKHLKKTYKP